MPGGLDHDLTIRGVAAGDQSDLLALWAVTWSATYGSVIGEAAVAEMIQTLAASDLAAMLPAADEERSGVALRAGRIVGSAIMAERGRTAYLWGMYVHPVAQRHGVGTALVRYVAGRLVGATAIEVRVLESSPWAEAFYRRCGFAEHSREAMPLGSKAPPVPGIVLRAAPSEVLETWDRLAPALR